MTQKVFINLPVKNLDKSRDFFSSLGFEFNQQFTDENGTAMILNEDAWVMLVTNDFFKTFTDKQLGDATTSTETIISLSADSREEVDEAVEKALANGGERATEPNDQGFMYSRGFHDLDGHLWECVWMEPAAAQ